MGLSSTGIGSGLQVEQIVSQLVALERQPIAKLKSVASSMQTQLSVFSQVKSLMSTLSDAATKLAKGSTWDSMSATSSNAAAVTVNASGAASSTSFGIGVQQLARGQSVASAPLGAAGATVGGGTLTIQLGRWGDTGAFTENTEPATNVNVSIESTDTLAAVASKINSAKAGVTATVLRDANGERLLVRSDKTGDESGFRIQVAESGGAGLKRLSFDPKDAPGIGMAANAAQYAKNAKATINGIAVESATNTFADTVPGLSFTALQTTAPNAQVEVAVNSDTAALKKNIEDFVKSYNAINDLLTASTKYDSETKKSGALQGDGTTVSLQNTLRNLMASTAEGATGAFARLADIGIDIKKGGKLEVAADKLDAALKNPAALKGLFANDAGAGSGANGLAVKVKAMTGKLLGFEGLLDNKSDALNASIKRNQSDQDRVDAKAAMVEKRLRAQYVALDVRMASLSTLSSYMGQQVSQWNRNSG